MTTVESIAAKYGHKLQNDAAKVEIDKFVSNFK